MLTLTPTESEQVNLQAKQYYYQLEENIMLKYAFKLALLLGVVSSFLIPRSYATVPNSFTNGLVADALEVNQNFNYFENKFSTSSGHDHNGSNSKLITQTGTIISGVWQGTVLNPMYGGTGQSSFASGDIVVAIAASTTDIVTLGSIGSVFIVDSLTQHPKWLAPGTSGQVLTTNGTNKNPSWGNSNTFPWTKVLWVTYNPATGAISECYPAGVTITNGGVGDETVNFPSNFSNTTYCVLLGDSSATDISVYDTKAVGSIHIVSFTHAGVAADPTEISVFCLGN